MDVSEDNVDTIDLTLSSPEPEQHTQMTPRQSQLPTYFKREPPSSGGTFIKYERARSSKHATSQQQQPSSNPPTLAQIVNSSDPAALKKVILELCQMSPALSGAITRGLASHQRTLRQSLNGNNDALRKPAVAVKNEVSTSSADEHMGKKLIGKGKAAPKWSMHSSQSHAFHSHHPKADHNTRTPGTSKSAFQVKREFPLGDSDSESDRDSLHVPGSFPRSSQRTDSSRTPLQDKLHSSSASSRATRPLSLSERLAIIQKENYRVPKRCSQCRELFTKEEDTCMYHPGHRTDQKGGETIWSCCKGPVKDLGCEIGTHVDPERRFKRPSVTPSPPGLQLKKSRLV